MGFSECVIDIGIGKVKLESAKWKVSNGGEIKKNFR